jgi:hypothetical protein
MEVSCDGVAMASVIIYPEFMEVSCDGVVMASVIIYPEFMEVSCDGVAMASVIVYLEFNHKLVLDISDHSCYYYYQRKQNH